MLDISDLQFSNSVDLINKNLHQITYRNELTELLFEKIGYLATAKRSNFISAQEEQERGLGA